MGLEIRAAQIRDKEQILSMIGSYPFKWDKRIAKRYYDDYFKNSTCLKGDSVYVLTDNGNIIGVIGYTLDRYETRNYWLGWFYVHSEYQGKGFAKKLLQYVIQKLKSKGVKRLFVDTSSYEVYNKALTMYLNNGFRIEAVIRDYYGRGEDQIILSKTVA
jgi:GNAT superfamily N-acetyltransferase